MFLDLQFRFSGLISYVPFVVDHVKILVATICFQISNLDPLKGPHQPSFLIWGIFALSRICFKLLALRNPIIRTPLNTLLCSLSGVKRRRILVILTFNWAREEWYIIILRTSLSWFSFLLWLLSNSALERFLAFQICFRCDCILFL